MHSLVNIYSNTLRILVLEKSKPTYNILSVGRIHISVNKAKADDAMGSTSTSKNSSQRIHYVEQNKELSIVVDCLSTKRGKLKCESD